MPNADDLRITMRKGVRDLQEPALAEIRKVLEGKKAISDVTTLAVNTLKGMIRVDDTTRMERENSASLSLRFIKILDGDEELRKEYMAKTAPRIPLPLRELTNNTKKKKK